MDLSKFNLQQKDAITHMGGNCAVLSSAGSGKTTVIVNRIAYMIEQGIKPERILAITFSRKSADDMKERLLKVYDGAKDMNVNTFHSVCYRILKVEDIRYGRCELMRDYFKKKIICDIVVKSLKLSAKDSDVEVGSILSFISAQKNSNLTYEDKLLTTDEMPYSLNIMQEIYMMYELEKIKKNYIDFDDMIMDCVRLFKSKSYLRRKYNEKFKYILVDEAQDVNIAQVEFLELMNGDNNNVFIVGDHRQCIFQFRGAEPSFLMDFYEQWNNVKIIQLPLNYRCSRDIVELSNQLLEDSHEATHELYVPSVSYKDYMNAPEYRVFESPKEETDFISEKVISLVSSGKYKYKDVAVIMRTNAQSRVFEQLFLEHKIPYTVCSFSSFYEKKEIQDMLNYLRIAIDMKDDTAFEKICNVPTRYLGSVFLDEVRKVSEPKGLSIYEGLAIFPRRYEWRYKSGIEQLEFIISKIRRMSGTYTVGTIIQELRKSIGYDDYIRKDLMIEENNSCAKLENLDSLCDQGHDYTSISSFLADIEKVIISQKEEKDKADKGSKDSVQLLTCHKSKGLEFKIVFVVGVNEGILPHYKNKNIDEERRLLYVSATRAEELLYISSVKMYNHRASSPSTLLYDMFDESVIDRQVDNLSLSN